MTIDEAKQVFLSRGEVVIEGGTIYDANKWREACHIISEWLEQEPILDKTSYEFVNGIELDPVYICDRDKSPCKNSDICYQPGGCFYTTDKDRALDPYTPLYMAESLKKLRKVMKNE